MGWGILLWSTEDPPILSGTMLPVYIKSNIEQVWVVGVPETARNGKYIDKIEVPLSQFEFVGSKRKAEMRANQFSQFAASYAENLQDRLPIRDTPDNNSRQIYRLRTGEIMKILAKAEGSPPISTTGDPLPGSWYKVLTQDGITGYCFSYRLKIFDHREGTVTAAGAVSRTEAVSDPDLDMAMSKKWSPESYLQMINSKQINISELQKNYRFDPGQETGIARLSMPGIEREFNYNGIVPDGERAWIFDGTSLRMSLRTNSTLAVQYTESTGLRRTLVFVSLASDVNDLILQEQARREEQFLSIYEQGPVFTSNNYGTITFFSSGGFSWTGYDLLVPQYIPPDAQEEGTVSMDLFLSPSFAERYMGAVTFIFSYSANAVLRFMYYLDNQGMRLEVLPDYAVEEATVTRRAPSPMVLYFFRDSQF